MRGSTEAGHPYSTVDGKKPKPPALSNSNNVTKIKIIRRLTYTAHSYNQPVVKYRITILGVNYVPAWLCLRTYF